VGGVGFSVSGSAVIIFVGMMVAAGIAVPALVGSMGALADSQGEQVDRGIDTLNTEFEVTSATYNESGQDKLKVNLTNTGSTTLTLEGTSVLIDGEIRPGLTGTGLWLPGDPLTITTGESSKPSSVKIVVENGIAETITGAEIQ